jgi:alpha-beta hydrolase superfamily lysophospholipase
MKKPSLLAGAFIIATIFATLFLVSCATDPSAEQLRRQALFNRAEKETWRSVGLERKDIQIAGDRIAYLEGGKGQTVLLLHGFADSKDARVAFAKHLTGAYHVAIPDLPGFGESTKRLDENYNIVSQVRRLDRFVEALGLQKFHPAGNSMGGMGWQAI